MLLFPEVRWQNVWFWGFHGERISLDLGAHGKFSFFLCTFCFRYEDICARWFRLFHSTRIYVSTILRRKNFYSNCNSKVPALFIVSPVFFARFQALYSFTVVICAQVSSSPWHMLLLLFGTTWVCRSAYGKWELVVLHLLVLCSNMSLFFAHKSRRMEVTLLIKIKSVHKLRTFGMKNP